MTARAHQSETADYLAAKRCALDLLNRPDSTDPLVWRWLEAKGVNYSEALLIAGPITRHMVEFFQGGTFALALLGETAFVQLVAGEDSCTPIDLLAWSPYEPRRFGTHLRRAGLLGMDQALNPASFAYGPCRLWRDPLRWLREGCRGAVVLDAQLARTILDRAPGPFAAEDIEHGRELLASLSVHRDRLFVPDHRRGRGAA